MTDAKGQMDAVEALKILVKEYGYKNLVLHIVGYMGKDSYELKVKKFIDDNGIENHVVLHSFTNSPFEISKECDIGLTCSAAEAFGRITVEYMLASLFTIGANTGGTPEIILDRESGLLYKQGDSRELANKIKWTLEHKDDANRMIWMGQNRALDNFAITATAREIRRVYGELVGN